MNEITLEDILSDWNSDVSLSSIKVINYLDIINKLVSKEKGNFLYCYYIQDVGPIYIGVSQGSNYRLFHHIEDSEVNPLLNGALVSYGDIIKIIYAKYTSDREAYYVRRYDTFTKGANRTPDGKPFNEMSPEDKLKLYESGYYSHMPMHAPDAIARRVASRRLNGGYNNMQMHTPEAKAKSLRTRIERYGSASILSISPEVRKKAWDTAMKSGGAQRFIKAGQAVANSDYSYHERSNGSRFGVNSYKVTKYLLSLSLLLCESTWNSKKGEITEDKHQRQVPIWRTAVDKYPGYIAQAIYDFYDGSIPDGLSLPDKIINSLNCLV